MDVAGQATTAVRLVEQHYQAHIDTCVTEAQVQPGAADTSAVIDGRVLAVAHERAWRRGIVDAARECPSADWAALTVTHEAAAYEHLLGWTADTYGVAEHDIRAVQTTRGYRHQQR